jgi:hypothetical protein
MKRIILMMMFAALFAGGMNAQDTNAKRTVLFTLGENEEIAYGEYFVMQQINQNHFACMVWDTVKHTHTLVFNGNRIVAGDDDKWWINVSYLNVHEENGYVIEYSLQDKRYVNIKGEVYGPFDSGSLTFGDDSNSNNAYDRFYYYKTEAGKRYYYLHYNGDKEGPFDGIRFPEKDGAYADCAYLFLLAGKWYAHYSNGSNKITTLFYSYEHENSGKKYVNINGRDSRGCDEIYGLRFTKSGKFAYYYKENGKYYVNINGRDSREYDMVYNLHFTERESYAYQYKENGKYYVNINGRDSRGYDEVYYRFYHVYGVYYGEISYNFYFTESEMYAYRYKENGKWHVNINGREHDKNDVGILKFTKSGKYAYTYKENEKEYVNININGTDKSSRGYDEVGRLYLTESGNCAYRYKENGKYYVNINGTDSRGYDEVGDYDKGGYRYVFDLTESGNYAYAYVENGKWHVNINDEDSRGYDKVWYVHLTENGKYIYYYKENGKEYQNINGREYDYDYDVHYNFTENESYAYYYKKNGKYYVNININGTDKSSRGYDEVLDLHFTENGKYAYAYYENGKWYVNINGTDSKGYDAVWNLELTEESNYSFYYSNDEGKIGKNNSGKETETEFLSNMWHSWGFPAFFGNTNFDSGNALEIYSTNKEYSFYSPYDNDFVVVDGKRCGKAPALYAWYDKTKNAFIWNAVEGKELVVYEYKL